MAAIFIDGMDHYAAADAPLKYNGGGSNWSSMQTGLLGTGQCGRMISSSTGPRRTLASSLTTFVMGFRYRTNNVNNYTLMLFLNGSGAAVASLCLTSSGAITWNQGNNSTVVATSSTGIVGTNAINYIEVKATLATTATGTVQVRMNGADVIPSTGSLTTAITTASFTTFGYLGSGVLSVNSDFDDLYLYDTTGSQNNTFAGDTRIGVAMPNGAGRVTQWTPNGAGTNFGCVNETTPNGDTTYVSSATAGQIDAYTLSSIGSPTAVQCVQICTDARKDDSATRTIAHGVGNGTTESFDAGTNVGSAYGYLVRMLDSNPLTSAAWATSDLATLQSAIKCIA